MNYFTHEKRYNTVNNFYKAAFKSKVFKVSLNGNFTCPNLDGTVGKLGCIFCSEMGSGDFAGDKMKSIKDQFLDIKNMMHKKWPDGKYIPYFQANSNTYGPLEKLKSLFEEALLLDESVVGLSIATRPDCLNEEIYDYLEDISKRTYLSVELGLQSSKESSLEFINRGHDLNCFVNAVKELRKRKINVIVHIINGLPNETKHDMLNTIKFLNDLDIQGIKIHMLFIQKNTRLADYYKKNPFKMLSLEAYVDIVVDQLQLLNENIIVHRLTGDSPRESLIEPKWSLKKLVVTNEIDKRMRKLDVYQGGLN